MNAPQSTTVDTYQGRDGEQLNRLGHSTYGKIMVILNKLIHQLAVHLYGGIGNRNTKSLVIIVL